MSTKVSIIQTHPIQHFCPQFTSYAQLPDIELNLFFESDKGLKPYFDPQFNKEVKWEGIDLKGFPHTFLNGNTLAAILDIHQPDVLIIYGYTKSIQKQALKWANQNHKKVFYISDSENHQQRHPLKQIIKRIVLRRFFKKTDVCMSVGDANEDFYKWCGVTKDKMARMFFPVDTIVLDKLYAEKETNKVCIRNKYQILANSIILSTIGKLVHWKFQEDIIRLVEELEKRSVNCTAFIMGSGEDLQRLKERSKRLKTNKVILTGFIQPQEMMQHLCATDIYVHPARIEPHSLAISEAIYLGCPAIISDRCGSYGPTDDVQPGKNGFVYPFGNIKTLADKVEYLFHNEAKLKEFSEASFQISRHNQKLAHGEALKAAINLINS